MKVVLEKHGHKWRADPADMPGTPPNGEGRSAAEAVGMLVFRMAGEFETWGKYGWPEFKVQLPKELTDAATSQS